MGSTGNIFSGLLTRRGYKSTEFWAMIFMLLVSGVGGAMKLFQPNYVLIACAIVVAAYIFSRGKAKSK